MNDSKSVKLSIGILTLVRENKKRTRMPVGAFYDLAAKRALDLQDPEIQASLMRFLSRKCKTKADAKEVFNYIINQQ